VRTHKPTTPAQSLGASVEPTPPSAGSSTPDHSSSRRAALDDQQRTAASARESIPPTPSAAFELGMTIGESGSSARLSPGVIQQLKALGVELVDDLALVDEEVWQMLTLTVIERKRLERLVREVRALAQDKHSAKSN
jgi:hypothetical protein